MKIAAIQLRSGPDPVANLAALEPLLSQAAAAGVYYALTPEVTMAFAENRAWLAEVAAPFENHPQLTRVGALAGQYGMHIHIGSLAAPLADGRFANRSVMFGPDGAVMPATTRSTCSTPALPGSMPVAKATPIGAARRL
ncbi:MAG: hypothetical protein MO852_04395 [Candidatus Devosia euplotis]|nr:hypothetical protein [Candidatus Devosia euplotis]